MILRTVSSKNTTLYYVQKSFRQENGKNATKYVERLGNFKQLEARFGTEDPIGEAKKYVAELTKAEKDAQKSNEKLFQIRGLKKFSLPVCH